MKRTVLDLTQQVLSSIKGDEVNSINDTLESQAVATILEKEYYDMISLIDYPEHRDLFELIASGDSTKPLIMTLPENVLSVECIDYNKIGANETVDNFQPVVFLDVNEFLRRLSNLDTSLSYYDSMTHTIGTDTFTLVYRNDSAPQFWTTWDDETVVFDSIDNAVDDTIVKNKTRCQGLISPTFTKSDSHVPDMDERHFPLLLNEAISTAWVELRDVENGRTERKSRKHRIRAHQKKRNVPDNLSFYSNNTSNFGR